MTRKLQDPYTTLLEGLAIQNPLLSTYYITTDLNIPPSCDKACDKKVKKKQLYNVNIL